jgi:hypothetical protein
MMPGSKEEKNKSKDKEKNKKLLLKTHKITENCKSDRCENYKKAEDKRCKRCPMFDLLRKLKKLKKPSALEGFFI